MGECRFFWGGGGEGVRRGAGSGSGRARSVISVIYIGSCFLCVCLVYALGLVIHDVWGLGFLHLNPKP